MVKLLLCTLAAATLAFIFTPSLRRVAAPEGAGSGSQQSGSSQTAMAACD